MRAGGTARRSAIASVRAAAPLSGYLLACPAAAAMTPMTDGSGPNGDSFDESLNYLPSPRTGVRPGL